jgi:acetate kinase
LIIAHLGNGANVTAVKDGGSIDTSMRSTPTGGVIMGTRRGDLDPGVLVYLLREMKLDAARLEDRSTIAPGSGGFGRWWRRAASASSRFRQTPMRVSQWKFSVIRLASSWPR